MQRMVPEGVEVVQNLRVLVIFYVHIRRMIVHSPLSMLLVLSCQNPARQFLWFSLAQNVQQFVNRGTLWQFRFGFLRYLEYTIDFCTRLIRRLFPSILVTGSDVVPVPSVPFYVAAILGPACWLREPFL